MVGTIGLPMVLRSLAILLLSGDPYLRGLWSPGSLVAGLGLSVVAAALFRWVCNRRSALQYADGSLVPILLVVAGAPLAAIGVLLLPVAVFYISGDSDDFTSLGEIALFLGISLIVAAGLLFLFAWVRRPNTTR